MSPNENNYYVALQGLFEQMIVELGDHEKMSLIVEDALDEFLFENGYYKIEEGEDE